MRDPAIPDERLLLDPVGLCAHCRHVKVIEARHTTFYLCRLSEVDPTFEKYPRLPVLRCAGYQPAGSPEP